MFFKYYEIPFHFRLVLSNAVPEICPATIISGKIIKVHETAMTKGEKL